jgi:taurine dioxygenase
LNISDEQDEKELDRRISDKASSGLGVRPLTTHAGAEIFGLDLTKVLSEQAYDEIRTAMHHYGVVFFRDQHLSSEQYLGFAANFGVPKVNPLTPTVPGFSAISRLIKEASHETSTGDMWHADHTFLPSPMNTILLAVEVPEYGGDTLWLNTRAAYEQLPEHTKTEIADLHALHSHSFLIKDLDYAKKHKQEHGVEAMNQEFARSPTKMHHHPVVRKHPHTGAEALFINPGYTVKFQDRSREQSMELLNRLYGHCLQPEFQCRFRWRSGSIAMWDNSHTWHFAVNDYAGQRREMHRIVLQ